MMGIQPDLDAFHAEMENDLWIDDVQTSVPFIDIANAPDGSIYGDLSLYLMLAGTKRVVQEHLPFRLMSWAARLATLVNRDHPTYWYTEAEPYRFVYHTLSIAGSGEGKDIVDLSFQQVLGKTGKPRFWHYDGGTLEGLRGSTEYSEKEHKHFPIKGMLETASDGWLFCAELAAISHAAKKDNHSISTLLKFMEKGRVSWALAKSHRTVQSDAALSLSIQPVILDGTIETIGQGLPRRVLIDWYEPIHPSVVKREELAPPPVPGSSEPILKSVRNRMALMETGFHPSAYDWSAVNPDIGIMADKGYLLVSNDYQIVRTVATAYTMLMEPDPSRWADKPFQPRMDSRAWSLALKLIRTRNLLVTGTKTSTSAK